MNRKKEDILFNNVYERNGSYVTAGQQDYAEHMNQIQTQKEAYYKKVCVAPWCTRQLSLTLRPLL